MEMTKTTKWIIAVAGVGVLYMYAKKKGIIGKASVIEDNTPVTNADILDGVKQNEEDFVKLWQQESQDLMGILSGSYSNATGTLDSKLGSGTGKLAPALSTKLSTRPTLGSGRGKGMGASMRPDAVNERLLKLAEKAKGWADKLQNKDVEKIKDKISKWSKEKRQKAIEVLTKLADKREVALDTVTQAISKNVPLAEAIVARLEKTA